MKIILLFLFTILPMKVFSQDEYEDVDIEDIDVSEDIHAMLADSDFSDDFKDKITTIFSAAVGAKVAQETARIEEEVEARFETEIDEAKDEIATQVDEYLSYATEEWMKDNEVAIVSEIMKAAQGDVSSYSVGKRDEVERIASSAR